MKEEFKYKSSRFSQAGTNHGSDEKNNEDAIISGSNDRFEVIALADGVSSCKNGGEGARITVETIKNYFLTMGESLMDMPDEKRRIEISSTIQSELKKQAEQEENDMEEYASTLATILIDKIQKRIMYFSVGDSLLVRVKDEKVYIITSPADSRQGIPTTVINDRKYFKTGVIEPRDGELAAESFLAYSDGAWKELYYRGRLKSEVKQMILGRDYTALSEYLKGKNTFDDCTFITLDTERELEKGEQTALEEKLKTARGEKEKLEQEAQKISDAEQLIEKNGTKSID